MAYYIALKISNQSELDFVHKLYGDFKTISLGDENLVKVIDRPEQIKEYLK